MIDKTNQPIPDITLEKLLNNGVSKNIMLPSDMIKHLMAGVATCCVSGRAGTGKVTVMRSIIRHTDPIITLRSISGDMEMDLRATYPYRNVINVSESVFLNTVINTDACVRRDKVIQVIREVCSDAVAAKMLYYHRVSCATTLFTHHADTTQDLVYLLRNSLFSTGSIANLQVAEAQVVSFLDFDIHMSYTLDGIRYIERITEVTRKENVAETIGEQDTLFEYARRNSEDAVTFNTRDIIRYDLDTHTYVVVNPLSDVTVQCLLLNMDSEKTEAFKQFLANNFVF